MKVLSAIKYRIQNRRAACLVIICLVVGAVDSAHAVPPNQVARDSRIQTLTGLCCISWNETASVIEPAKVVPVAVTFSTDFQLASQVYIFIGLSLNGGACQAFGAGSLQQPIEIGDREVFDSRTFQFVILPGEGLQRGNNTITVCGGGRLLQTDTILIGPNTLEVRLSK